ncbi:MAG: FAD-dependent oxidoreductase [Gammaproteobacteria bacterium]|nr:FAD-dependent oxidoreductase [Gammaproteobacteria bacterium]
MTQAITCGEATIRLLEKYGVNTVFGIPGVHTLDFCRGLDQGVRHVQARNLGATISRRNRVLDINRLAGGEFEVVTEQGNIVAQHVVNAGGCYAREVSQMVGVQTPITNMEHQYLVTEALQEFEDSDSELPVMRDPYTAGYYRQEQKSGLIGIYEQANSQEAWGASGGSPQWAAENELFGEDIDRISPWLEKAMQRMPIFANAGIKKVINGAIPHTPDGNPLLGPA